MNVILLEKVQNLGDLGENVNVKSGYGRNYLIPKGIAVPATPVNVEKFEARRAELEKIASEKLAAAESRKQSMSGLVVEITHNAGEEGKLFGSIGTAEIADAITSRGVEVSKREVKLPNGPIRQVGDHEIEIELMSDVVASVVIKVTAE
jgi:large subunit ribosomal protein L9